MRHLKTQENPNCLTLFIYKSKTTVDSHPCGGEGWSYCIQMRTVCRIFGLYSSMEICLCNSKSEGIDYNFLGGIVIVERRSLFKNV